MQEDYKYEYVKLDQIEADPNQPRKNKPQSHIKQLAQSIASEGLKNPIDVIPHPETPGWKRLVNGECRSLAFMFLKDYYDGSPKAGFKVEDGEIYVLCRVFEKPMSKAEIFKNQVLDNLVRLNLSDLENLEAINEALTEHGMSVEEISRAFGLSVALIEADLPILQLPSLMKKEWDEGRLPKSVARKIAGLEPRQYEKAYEWAKSGRTAEVMLKKIDAYLEECNQMSLWTQIKDGADEKTRKACKVLYGQLHSQMEKFSKSPYTNGESKTFILCNKNRLSEIERTAKEMEKISKSILGALCEFRVKDKNAAA